MGKGAVVCEGGRVVRCREGRRQRSISAPSLAWTRLVKVKGGRPQALMMIIHFFTVIQARISDIPGWQDATIDLSFPILHPIIPRIFSI